MLHALLLAVLPLAAAQAAPGMVLAGAPINDIRVSVDNAVQCGQATISWSGNSGAVQVRIGLGGYYVGLDWLAEIPALTGSSTTWTVNQAAGSSLIVQVTDATGAFNYIQNVPVASSGDTSCLSGPSAAGTKAPEAQYSSGSSGSSGSTAGTTPAPDTTQDGTGAGQEQDTVSPPPASSAPAEAQPASPNSANSASDGGAANDSGSGNGAASGATSTLVVAGSPASGAAAAPSAPSAPAPAAGSSGAGVSVARPAANASAAPVSTSGASRAAATIALLLGGAAAALVAA